MSRVVLSIGSNLGDRLARLQAAVDGLGETVSAVSPVFETDPWGGVSQEPFLNAIVLADDAGTDAHGWLRRAQARNAALSLETSSVLVYLQWTVTGMDQFATLRKT